MGLVIVGFMTQIQTQTRTRPWWTWLFFVQLAIVVGAGVLASLGWMPGALFSSGVDKLGHFLGLGVLSFLSVSFFRRSSWRRTVLVIAAASVLEEVSQGLFPARTFDFGDMAANLVGIALFGGLAAGLVSAAGAPALRARQPLPGSRPAARHGSTR